MNDVVSDEECRDIALGIIRSHPDGIEHDDLLQRVNQVREMLANARVDATLIQGLMGGTFDVTWDQGGEAVWKASRRGVANE